MSHSSHRVFVFTLFYKLRDIHSEFQHKYSCLHSALLKTGPRKALDR